MSFVGQQLVAVDVNSNQFWNYNNQNIRFLSIGNLQNMVAGRNVCLLRVPRGIQLMNNETEQVLDSVQHSRSLVAHKVFMQHFHSLHS